MRKLKRRDRGSVMLVVVVFLAASIAALAGITAGRVVHATKRQEILEQETRALNSAYSQIHMAMNVVNNSAYNEQNQNLVLRDAIAGFNGGTVIEGQGAELRVQGTSLDPDGGAIYFYENGKATRLENAGGELSGYVAKTVTQDAYQGAILNQDPSLGWLDDPSDPKYGLIGSTNVRVYKGRDYIKRLARLKGKTVTDVDPAGLSDSYYVIEAAGRAGDTVRLVSALVRENEPFSSFVFFQNRATLGVSGAPRGLIHSNDQIAFYFPNGSYVDSVSAVNGFDYMAGADVGNTNLRNANPSANSIALENVDFAKLKEKATLFQGQAGLDADVSMDSSGTVRIKEYTPPHFEMVEKSLTYQKFVGYHWETYTVNEPVQIGTQQVPYTEQVLDHYVTETYTVNEPVQVGTTQVAYTVQEIDYFDTVTKYKTEQVVDYYDTVTKYKTEDVYELQTVTKTRQVQVWQSYNQGDAGGGTSVGGGGAGDLGEWVWVTEQYQAEEMVKVGTKQVPYDVQVPVYKTVTTPYTEQVPVYKTVTKYRTDPVYENQDVVKTRQVPVYETVTKYRTDPVYENQDVVKDKKVADYVTVTDTWTEEQFFYPVYKSTTEVSVKDAAGTIYVDGDIRQIAGDLNGRLSIIANKNVRVTGSIRYVDDAGNTAMKNGSDYAESYTRNADYAGNSVLGVIAREDILFTRFLPASAEINGTLMAVNGRVGIDGFWADAKGELEKDSASTRKKLLTMVQQEEQRAKDRYWLTATYRFTKDSLRRIGGLISNNRVMETYIKTQSDGTTTVDAGFKRGNMKFDINLLFNPPPNFVEVPRPVLTYFVPIIMVRNSEN